MRHKMMKMGMLVVVLAAFATGVVAQHEEHHSQEQATKPEATQPKTPNLAQPEMMAGGMMGMMMNMMGQNRQMSDTINKMTQNTAAMQKEKDPAKMKTMMADQSSMMDRMRNKMTQQGGMMQNMSGMMNGCPMMGTTGQTTAPGNPSGP